MGTARTLAPLAALAAAVACGSVPADSGARLYPAAGVIRGTVLYSGPHPCSRAGHIVGNAVMLVFDRRNPPPPNGLANTAVNFADVTGDALFGDEPRYTGSDTYCPAQHGFTDTITASAPFEIAPLTGGSYMIASFFDYTGDFLPSFKFRNLPELGDIAGGDIDTADALRPVNVGNPNYQPHFLPVEVGVAQPLEAGALPTEIPNYTIPDSGYVADNVSVAIGAPLATTRPYFYPQGLQVNFDLSSAVTAGTISTSVDQSSDAPAMVQVPGALEDPSDPTYPDYAPVLTIPQDIQVLAPPGSVTPANANNFESKFPHLRLEFGMPTAELAIAADPTQPFHMQLQTQGAQGSFLVWQNATLDPQTQTYVPQQIAEGNNVPYLWPLVVLSKLVDDPEHATDPASLTPQGDAKTPVVVMQGITLLGSTMPGQPEALFATVTSALTGQTFKGGQPVIHQQDHVTVLLRPSVICFDSLFDPLNPDKRGTLVTPALIGNAADLDCSTSPCKPSGQSGAPLVPPTLLANPQIASQVAGIAQGCLPMGRYAINAVYPDGQAWTVPNEAGACAGPNSSEGATDYAHLTCTLKPRPVLYSQGNRAVVEIGPAQDPNFCMTHPVPAACLPTP